jgi:hypothetical protein
MQQGDTCLRREGALTCSDNQSIVGYMFASDRGATLARLAQEAEGASRLVFYFT